MFFLHLSLSLKVIDGGIKLQKSFKLFSDEVKRSSQQLLFSSFLVNLQKVFKNVRLYTDSHQSVRTALAAFKTNTKNLFEHRQSLVIIRIGGKLITPEVQLSVTDPKVVDLAKVMNAHQIRKIRLWQGVTNREIIEVCKIIAMKPEELLEAGGIRFLLTQAGISTVEVDVALRANSSETGNAGMFEATGHGGATNKNWLIGLKKVGINEAHFIDYLLHKPTSSAMLQRELQLAVQAFSSPREVAELLIYLSTDPEDPDNILPEIMFSLMQRIENVMLMHSAIAEKEITKQLVKAAQLLPELLRLELLFYYCNATLEGKIITSFKLFSFSIAEYYEVILDEYSEDGTLLSLNVLHLSQETLEILLRYCQQRLRDELTGEQLKNMLTSLRQAAALSINQLTLPQLIEAPLPEMTLLTTRVEELQHDLELGYLYVLTAFMIAAKDEARMLDVCTRLTSLLDLYLSKQDYETLIPIFKQFTELDATAMQIFNQVYWGNLSEQQLTQISNFFIKYSTINQHDAAELLRALQQYFPANFIPELLLKITHKRSFSAYRFISQLINMGQNVDMLYDELLKSSDIRDNIAAFDLINISHNQQAETMLIAQLQQRKTATGCRLGIIFMLASFPSEASRAILTDIVAGKASKGLSNYRYRCAAVTALSIRKDAMTIPVLHNIIKHRKLWRREHQIELRSGAALALKKIATVETATILNSNLDKLRRTWLVYITQAINKFIEKEFLFIKRTVMFVLRPIIFLITLLMTGIAKSFKGFKLLVKFIWHLICRFIIYLAKFPVKVIIFTAHRGFNLATTLKLRLKPHRKQLIEPDLNEKQANQGVKQ